MTLQSTRRIPGPWTSESCEGGSLSSGDLGTAGQKPPARGAPQPSAGCLGSPVLWGQPPWPPCQPLRRGAQLRRRSTNPHRQGTRVGGGGSRGSWPELETSILGGQAVGRSGLSGPRHFITLNVFSWGSRVPQSEVRGSSRRLPQTGLLFSSRLIDGINVTMEDNHMWLIPFRPGEDHRLTIQFRKAEDVAGLRIWNYNKSPEDTYRGVSGRQGTWPGGVQPGSLCSSLTGHCRPQAKVVHVSLDGARLSPPEGFLVRKGPGTCHFDFAQEILFVDYLKGLPAAPACER